jgi:cytochrome P450
VGRQPDLFLSGPKLLIREDYGDENFVRPPTLIEMDNPLHRAHRKLISNRFTPRALQSIHGDIERIAKEIVQTLLDKGDNESVEFAFKYLLPRIDEIEVAGPIDRLHSNLVGGIKRLPIRYKLKAA